ncbi:hypothetical protein B0537_10415 [Desulforamulus ferrireducens]|uniref:Uncharacterized protein n=1 Tax=Desulforamulus ferrireducens TaxID=1833852 RepID=A0A1S6IXF7_9FIRM|nr:hypothetical protein B0537_10415 [Desulforamulus ferrireducens]
MPLAIGIIGLNQVMERDIKAPSLRESTAKHLNCTKTCYTFMPGMIKAPLEVVVVLNFILSKNPFCSALRGVGQHGVQQLGSCFWSNSLRRLRRQLSEVLKKANDQKPKAKSQWLKA